MSTHLAISTNPKNPTQLPIDKGGSTIVNLSTKTVYLGTWYFLPTKTSELGRGSLPVESGPIYGYAKTGTVVLSVVPGLATPSIPNAPATIKSTAWITSTIPLKISTGLTSAAAKLSSKNSLVGSGWRVWPQTSSTVSNYVSLTEVGFGTNANIQGALLAIPISQVIPSGKWTVSLNMFGTAGHTVTTSQQVVRIGYKKNNSYIPLGSLVQTVSYGPAKSASKILTLLFSGTLPGANTTTTKQIYMEFWWLGHGGTVTTHVYATWGNINNPISLPLTV